MANDPKDDFQTFVQNDLSWRKREMSDLKSLIFDSSGLREHTLIRAGVALLYSHWEGHIKKCAQEYISYLNSRNLNLSDLSDNNITSYLYYKNSLLNGSKRISSYSDMSIVVCGNLSSEKFNIPAKNIIKTESNLKLRQLEDILHVVGLDNSKFMACKAQIDETLLHQRNSISHGERTESLQETALSRKSFYDLHDKIIELIDHFSSMLVDHVINDKFLKKTAP